MATTIVLARTVEVLSMSEFRKVTAIIRTDALERVEDRLVREGVKGVSGSYVKGYGEYKNFFTHDWLSRHVRIEIYTAADARTP